MAGTRTAPLFTATANFRRVTIHLIDTSGDLWTEEMIIPVGQSATTVEAWIAAYQAATQASIYQVTDQLIRSGAPVAANAQSGYRAGGDDGVNVTYKNFTDFSTLPTRVVAPDESIMNGLEDVPDTTTTEFVALRDAILAIKTGFSFVAAQFTSRRERKNNARVKTTAV